jgi:TetR/AcrR family transcriptional regulator, transcriptional repressor for nem operon
MSRSGDEGTRAMIDETLRNDSLAPPKRLRAFVDGQINYLNRNGWRNGCLVGNFTAEASEHSEVIRKRIVQTFEEMRQSVAYCLRAAVKSGDLSRKSDCDELAGFLIASLQGAILQSKAEANRSPHRALQAFAFLDAPALNGLLPFGSVAWDYARHNRCLYKDSGPNV